MSMSGAPLADWDREAIDALSKGSEAFDAPSNLPDWDQEALDAITPPGTRRYGNLATEYGADLARGTANTLTTTPLRVAGAVIAAPDVLATGIRDFNRGNAPRPNDPGVVEAARNAVAINNRLAALENERFNPTVTMQDYAPPVDGSPFSSTTEEEARLNARRRVEAEYAALASQLAQARGGMETLRTQDAARYNAPIDTGALTAGASLMSAAQQAEGDINRAIPPSAARATGERGRINWRDVLGTSFESAPQAIATFLITSATGGLAAPGAVGRFVTAGAPIQFGQAMGTQFDARTARGETPVEATAGGVPWAAVDAAVNSYIESMTAGGLLPGPELAIIKRTLRQRVIDTLKSVPDAAASSMLQEGGQEFASATIEKKSGADPNAMNPDRLLPRVATAALAGLVSETPMSAAGQFAQRGAVNEGAGSNNATTSGRDPVPNAPARFDPRVAQEAFAGTPEVKGPVVDSRTTPATAGTVDPADAAQTAGDVPQGAKGSPGATEDGGAGIDLAAVEAAGRQDAADNLEPEALPDGTDPAVVEAYTRG
jgi:hypothetical protein